MYCSVDSGMSWCVLNYVLVQSVLNRVPLSLRVGGRDVEHVWAAASRESA